jgi:hypothetical protein
MPDANALPLHYRARHPIYLHQNRTGVSPMIIKFIPHPYRLSIVHAFTQAGPCDLRGRLGREFIEAVGGKFDRMNRVRDWEVYNLTTAQARDLKMLIDCGWNAAMPDPYDDGPPTFWRSDPHGIDFNCTRKEAVALCERPAVCRRTFEMAV